MPAGMPMDPFALLLQMSDRLIDESYQPSKESGTAAKRAHSGGAEAGAGDEVEPQSKVPKRDDPEAQPSSSSKHRRYLQCWK